jgi:hemin uptake protein HemP
MRAAEELSRNDRVRTVTSDELFSGESELLIHHNGVQYRLRITRQDKLILTK